MERRPHSTLEGSSGRLTESERMALSERILDMVTKDPVIQRAVEVNEVDAANLVDEADSILSRGGADPARSIRRSNDVEERLEYLRGFRQAEEQQRDGPTFSPWTRR